MTFFASFQPWQTHCLVPPFRPYHPTLPHFSCSACPVPSNPQRERIQNRKANEIQISTNVHFHEALQIPNHSRNSYLHAAGVDSYQLNSTISFIPVATWWSLR